MANAVAGQPLNISAKDWNSILSFVQSAITGQGNATGNGSLTANTYQTITVINTSGAKQPMGAVMGIDTMHVEPTDEYKTNKFKFSPVFKLVKPLDAEHQNEYVILTTPIAVDGVGKAVLSGMAAVKIDVSDEAEKFKYAKIVDDSTVNLKASHAGRARILYVESGTGVKWGMVDLGSEVVARKVFKITLATQDGTNNRWIYEGREQYKQTAGYDGWSDLAGGLVDAALFDLTSDTQIDGGKLSSGVDLAGDDFPAGFLPKPLEVGTFVEARPVYGTYSGAEEWWIVSHVTQVDGTC